MPCNSEYMEPTYGEIQSRKVCQMIWNLHKKLNTTDKASKWVINAKDSFYGDQGSLPDAENLLYRMIKSLSKKELDLHIYNARSKESRELADWFEDFDKEMKDEKKRNERKKQQKKQVESILSKLRAEEVEILKNYLKDS